jgi:DNA (cytosine-5)-methyltransferase 1
VKPRLLDLYCKAGGAGKGYADAGFEVVGVDIAPQPNYPFEFVQIDALAAIRDWLLDATDPYRVDVIHDSPNLIPVTRALLEATGLPYVIENVEGARDELRNPVKLCGTGFGLDVRRHRLFESNVPMFGMACAHGRHAAKRFPGGRSKEQTGSNRGLSRTTVEVGTWDIPLDVQQRAMGIDWMTLEELSEAIPPVYTEHIGGYLMAEVKARAAACPR